MTPAPWTAALPCNEAKPRVTFALPLDQNETDKKEEVRTSDDHPVDSPMEGIESSHWNKDRLARLMEPDSDDSDEGLVKASDGTDGGKTPKPILKPFVPTANPYREETPTGPRNARSFHPPLHHSRRRLEPRPPSRRYTVDRYDYERYLDWCEAQKRKGWLAEDRFVAETHHLRKPCQEYLDEMTDNDHRRHGGGGGGYNRGYGGGGSRKRKFYGDDDDNNYDRRPARRNDTRGPPLSVRVRDQLFTIADSAVRNAEEDCAALADVIAKNEEDSYFIEHITDAIARLVIEQPFKVPHAAAVVLHINDKGKPAIVSKTLDKSQKLAQTALNAGEWRSLKLLLRFFAATNALFEDSTAIITLLEELFGRASDLQMASSEDALGIELVKIIQLTIPFALASGTPGLEQPVAELLEKTGIIASAPQECGLSVSPWASSGTQEAPELSSMIQLLQMQLQAEAEQGFPLKIITRPYVRQRKAAAKREAENGEPADDEEAEDKHDEDQPAEDEEAEAEPAKYPFPALSVPEKLNAGPRALFPEVFFSVFADQDVETVPRTSQLASSIIRDTCADTINILDFNRNKAVKYLVELDNYFPKDTFSKRGVPFDAIRALGPDQPSWKPEDMLMDALFSQLMILPTPEHKLVYYHSCITVSCVEAAAAIAPSLGRAIRFLYDNLDILDVELGYRFMDWFSHHLSNYDFRWKWVEWVEDVKKTELDPANAFIRGVIDKEIRLSFAKRIRDSLPEDYLVLIPNSKDNDIPPFKYSDESTPFSEEGKIILNALKMKQPDADILPTLTKISEQADSGDASFAVLPAVDAYTTALCFIGSKSLSHMLSFIERCKHRLLAFSREAADPAAADAARTQIIDSVVSYWQETQAGVAVNLIDKLLNYGILSPASVVSWALGGAEGDATLPHAPPTALSESWLFEAVSGTVNKVTNRVRQIIAARMSTGLAAAQLAQLDETLERETAEMRRLFDSVERPLSALAATADPTAPLLSWWGARWLRVFERKRRVEERILAESRPLFPGPAADAAMDVDGDGDDEDVGEDGVNGDGDADADGV